MDGKSLGRLVKVRDVGESGSAYSRWVALEEIEIPSSQVVLRDSGQAIFEQSTEPIEAQPGDFWIQEDE